MKEDVEMEIHLHSFLPSATQEFLATDPFDSRHYQKKKVVGLERGPLSLVSTTEELLDRKVVAAV
jgi:hypothetical protein